MPNAPESTKANPPPDRRKDEVTVTYNGVDKELPYQPRAVVNSLLEQAMNAFNVTENRHTMALFTTAGIELALDAHLDGVVKPGDVLVLRPSAVRGGDVC